MGRVHFWRVRVERESGGVEYEPSLLGFKFKNSSSSLVLLHNNCKTFKSRLFFLDDSSPAKIASSTSLSRLGPSLEGVGCTGLGCMALSLALWSSRVSSFAEKKRRKEKGKKGEIINRMREAERCRKESLLRVFFSAPLAGIPQCAIIVSTGLARRRFSKQKVWLGKYKSFIPPRTLCRSSDCDFSAVGGRQPKSQFGIFLLRMGGRDLVSGASKQTERFHFFCEQSGFLSRASAVAPHDPFPPLFVVHDPRGKNC